MIIRRNCCKRLMLGAAVALTACGPRDDGGGSKVGKTAALDRPRLCALISDAPIHLPGGSFLMGENDVYPEEGPARQVSVDEFSIDRHEVTNRQFAAFVQATGYVTVAEKPVDPRQFSVPADQIPPDLLKPGSAVFTPPDQPSTDYRDWWKYVPGASWNKPYGPSGPAAVPGEPVVHLAYADMIAYAKWRGGRLPTEAEWEYAAAAGTPSTNVQPVDANSWQGVFPVVNQETDGFKGVAPVGCYKPNRFGLYDMIGNVWEMTSDFYAAGPDTHVIKGGSYLCAPNYCRRYRSAARQGHDSGLGTSNVGFRLVYDRSH
jgi:formylglycine-generating enzyme required for sulfatase activity